MAFQPEQLPSDFADALSAVGGRLRRIGSSILFFSSTGSTNDVAAALATSGDREGAVVIADSQTAGRGRRGRAWFSPPGAGLYVSIVLAPGRARQAPDRATALLPLAAGVALAEAVECITGLRPELKWPNDLVIGRRKLAGILAEGVATAGAQTGVQWVVLGYGLNVNSAAYPPELGSLVTSLEAELGRPVDRSMLCAETLAAVAVRYADLLDARFDAILEAWRARAPASRGARVSWDTPAGRRTGTTAGVDDTGALLVRVDTSVERIVGGEVVWVR